jgi:hypothetical protein
LEPNKLLTISKSSSQHYKNDIIHNAKNNPFVRGSKKKPCLAAYRLLWLRFPDQILSIMIWLQLDINLLH